MNERIKQIRQSYNLSMRDFAEKLGLTHGAISLIESGQRPVNTRLVKNICAVFPEINEDWLLTGEGDMKAPANRQTEIANITELLMNEPEDSFKSKLIRLAAGLTAEQIDVLIDMLKTLI